MSATAEIRALALAGRVAEAEAALTGLVGRLFGLDVTALRINFDQYSLNSLNGFFEAGGEAFFFKFHQEEGEEKISGEYYRADILARAGLPVDMPVFCSALPGEQVLVYRRRNDRRFADVLRALDGEADRQRDAALAAEAGLSDRIFEVYRRSLHEITSAESEAEPVHRLFYERLVEPETQRFPGGRLKRLYVGQTFRFPGVEVEWDEFRDLKFVVNGVEYADSVGALFEAAHARLKPGLMAGAGVVAHGDAHNANVWFEERGRKNSLVFFDPAFAGENVPALLAEVKATFHNVLAHPYWLYDAAMAGERFSATSDVSGGRLVIETDWAPGETRLALLKIKAERVWRPLLRLLRERELLPADWRRVVKLGLFLCPTLVMNLRAGVGGHNEVSSAIGFAVAVMAGSEPLDGRDFVAEFLDGIDPGGG
jgi:hypothetical protein